MDIHGNIASVLLQMHNQARSQHGLPALVQDPRLMQAAQEHSAWMQSTGVMSHNEGKETFTDRLTAAGYAWSFAGENIAAGYPNANAVFQAWMASPGHRANILSPHCRQVGFGIAGTYWTVDFAAPMPGFEVHLPGPLAAPGYKAGGEG